MNNADLVQLRSIQSDITYFKEDILKSIKVIENKLTQKISLQTTNMNDTLTSYNKNFEHVYQKIKDLAELITTDNAALDKIATLLTFKASTIENLTAFDVKQNRIDIDLQNAIFKYDKIILEHILYPSIIGNNCKFRTMHDFVDYCLNQISHFNSFKDKQILDLKSYKVKLETVIKSFQTQIESITKTYSQLTEKKVNESELKMKSLLKVYDDRLEDIRIENGTYAVQLKNLCESLSKEWQGVLSIKNDIETTIQTQVDVIKEDNAKVLMCFENYQNEFKGIKSKFNMLSDAIKDIRKQLGALGRKSVVCKEQHECECGRRGSLRGSYGEMMVMNGFSGKDAESFLKKYIKGEVDLNMMIMNQERRRSNKQRRESRGSCGSFGNEGKGGSSRRISIVKGKHSGKGLGDGNNNNKTMEDEEKDYEDDKGSNEEKRKKGKEGNYKRKNKSGSRKRECDNESSLSESCEDNNNNNKEWSRKGIREKEHKRYKNEIINETDDYSDNVNSHNKNVNNNENNVNILHNKEKKKINHNNNNNNNVRNKEQPKSEIRKLKNISIKPFFINVNFDKNNKHLNTDNNPTNNKYNTNLQSDSESEHYKENKHNRMKSNTSNNSINNSTNNINPLQQHQTNLSYDNINISNNKQPQMPSIGSVHNNQVETFSKTTTNLTKNNPLNLKSYSSSSNHKLTNIQKQSMNPNNASNINNRNQQKSRNYNSQSPHPQTKQQQRHYPNIILSDSETQQDKIHLHKLKLKQLELNLSPLNSVALFNNTNVRSSNNNINNSNKNIQSNQNRTHTKQFYNASNNNVNVRSLSRNKTRNEELKQSNSYSVFPFLNANPSSTFKGHKRNYTSSNIINNSNKAYDPSVSSIECIRGIKLENKNKLKEVNYFRTFFADNNNNNNNNGNSIVYNSLNNIGRNGNKNAKKITMQLKEDNNNNSNNSTINGVHYMPINKILTNVPKNIPEGKNVLLTNPERYYIKEVEFEKQCK